MKPPTVFLGEMTTLTKSRWKLQVRVSASKGRPSHRDDGWLTALRLAFVMAWRHQPPAVRSGGTAEPGSGNSCDQASLSTTTSAMPMTSEAIGSGRMGCGRR